MERLLDLGCDLFIKLGPGGVVDGLLKRTRNDADVIAGGERKRGVVDLAIVFAARNERRRNFESCAGDDCRSRRQLQSANGRGHKSSAGKGRGPRRWQNAQRRSAEATLLVPC